MEKLISLSPKDRKVRALRTMAAVPMLITGTEVASPFIPTPIVQVAEASGIPCKGELVSTYRNFKDIGGVLHQYDPGIDIPEEVIPDAKVAVTINGQEFDYTTNQNGVIDTGIKDGICDGPNNSMIFRAVAITADGRRISQKVDIVVPNNKGKRENGWIEDEESAKRNVPQPTATATATAVATETATATATATATVTATAPKVEGPGLGERLGGWIDSHARDLGFPILGALVAVAALSLWNRSHHNHPEGPQLPPEPQPQNPEPEPQNPAPLQEGNVIHAQVPLILQIDPVQKKIILDPHLKPLDQPQGQQP